MKKIIAVVFLIMMVSFSSLFSETPEDYFGSPSILFSSANAISMIKGCRINPYEIANAIHYESRKDLNIDTLLKLIAATYDLDLHTFQYKNNKKEVLEFLSSSRTPVIVTYQNNGREHSAVIAGSRQDAEDRVQSYILYDSALGEKDFLGVRELKSEYWKLPINRLYTFSINPQLSDRWKQETNLFKKYLLASQMIYTPGEEFVETSVLTNRELLYQYALKHSSKKLEVRYAFFPYAMDQYAANNAVYKEFARTIALNIAGNEKNILRQTEFSQRDVTTEFFADWGASILVKCKSGFGKGYKMAMIVALHKSNVADAYEIFLFDEMVEVMDVFTSQYYSIVFK